ncbi:hypothetical protein DAH66_18360 [Sphingomonas koreensis]|uniref:Lipoprotein n=1 Tax=Sphingomonas koreensis TaxID=93064 RepID=A0A430FZJ2_9SPHN|nr:hypothetical protein [Sphingomonas koreensis]RSY78803.1 hypothetical protein DAH66_18360 [Sphingomonas koreensis]
MKRIAILAPLVPLALVALSACGDNGAREKAAAEAKAKAQETQKAKLLEDGLALNTRCFAAVKWQQRLLDSPVPRSIAGGSQPFLDYYRKMIADKLGDQVVAAEGAKPELSKASLDAYLDWAAKDQAENVFAKGDRTQNYATVTTCVQSAAEFGTGTMAKISPAERLGKIQQLRQIMDTTGS